MIMVVTSVIRGTRCRSDGRMLFGAEAVIALLKESGDYDADLCNRLRTILVAPHKHKDREARKTKELGTSVFTDIFRPRDDSNLT